MKITKTQLRQIIKEEVENTLQEFEYDPFSLDAMADKRADDERSAKAEKAAAAAKKAKDDEASAKREPLEKKRKELDRAIYRISKSLQSLPATGKKPGFFASREEKMNYQRYQTKLKRMKALEAEIAEIDKELEAL